MHILKANGSILKANNYVLKRRFTLHTICNNCQDNKDIPILGNPSNTLSNYQFDNPGYTFNGTPFMGKLYTIVELKKLNVKVVFYTTNRHMAFEMPGFEIFIDTLNRVFIRIQPNGSFQTNTNYFSHEGGKIKICQIGNGNSSGVQFDVNLVVDQDGTFKITVGSKYIYYKPTSIRSWCGPVFMDSGTTTSKMKLLELKVNI